MTRAKLAWEQRALKDRLRDLTAVHERAQRATQDATVQILQVEAQIALLERFLHPPAAVTSLIRGDRG